MDGMTTVVAPLCATCKHLIRDDEPTLRCPAFPAGIPDDVLSSEFDHREIHPDQVGMTLYEPEDSTWDKYYYDPFRPSGDVQS